MRWKIIGFVSITLLGGAIAAAIRYGTIRWQAETKALHTELEAARRPVSPSSYDPAELAGLPEPVQRYFRAVLKEGQPLVAAVKLTHTGTFNMSESGEQWQPFNSSQRVTTRRPGFVWDARIELAPALPIFVYDAYVAGAGALTAQPLGLLTVMEQPNTPELAQGELMRFLAEAVWYPTALLPSQGVVWQAIDDRQASATLTDGTTTARLVFQFDEQGLIEGVYAEGRYRAVAGTPVATPWQGRFWEYEWRDGMLIPLEGEVGWLLEDGLHLYWRGRIQRAEYEYAS